MARHLRGQRVGAVALTLALLPALRRARGHVVFINSGAGQKVSPGLASYSASKFALRAFADSLRADEPDLRVTRSTPAGPTPGCSANSSSSRAASTTLPSS